MLSIKRKRTGNPPGVFPLIVTGMAILVMMTAMSATCLAETEIYFFIDQNGHYHYSNVPTTDRYVPSKLNFIKDPGTSSAGAISSQYDAIIREAATTHGLDFSLVKAVIKAESNFNPNAVSHAGAQGLMQIMPANFESFELADPFDPKQNIKAGTRYLKYLINRYDHDLHLALAAYNAGPGIVDHYRDIPPFRETRGYVQRVLAYYDQIKHGR